MIFSATICLSTSGCGDMIDLTDRVAETVAASGVSDGIAVVFVPGATGAVTTIEYEPGLVQDMKAALERVAPKEIDYAHNRRWGDGNGHSHIRASLVGPSLTVPVIEGKLTLGVWQQIVFLEMDERPRDRNVLVEVIGE